MLKVRRYISACKFSRANRVHNNRWLFPPFFSLSLPLFCYSFCFYPGDSHKKVSSRDLHRAFSPYFSIINNTAKPPCSPTIFHLVVVGASRFSRQQIWRFTHSRNTTTSLSSLSLLLFPSLPLGHINLESMFIMDRWIPKLLTSLQSYPFWTTPSILFALSRPFPSQFSRSSFAPSGNPVRIIRRYR